MLGQKAMVLFLTLQELNHTNIIVIIISSRTGCQNSIEQTIVALWEVEGAEDEIV